MIDRTPRATGDFETRSEVSLLEYGGWIYSKHPSTRPLCFSYRLPFWEPGRTGLWHCAHEDLLIGESRPPEDLFEWLANGGLFEAHNSFFEWCIWTNIMMPAHGWPAIPDQQWRCSAAKASASSLPRALEDACYVLDLPVKKDMEGNAVMKRLMKPRKLLKAERAEYRKQGVDPDTVVIWNEDEEDIVRNWSYCRTDVLAEEALSEALPDLTPEELRVWMADQRMNRRGVKIDVAFARAALDMADKEKERLNGELFDLTGIPRGSMRQRVKDWCEVEGYPLQDTTGDYLDWLLTGDALEDPVRRVVEITREVNRTSTKKFDTMLKRADPDDDRVRDILMYCGADRTGRWSGKAVQPQNMPRGNIKGLDMDAACEDILSGDVDWCRVLYGDVMELLSSTARGALIAGEGKELISADYSAIEAVVVLWLAGAKKALEVFERGGDIYCDMAEGIYGYPVDKRTHPGERQFGKQAILGLGFGMGYLTFLLTCKKYKIKFTKAQVRGILGDEEYKKICQWVKEQLGFASPEDEDPDQKRGRILEARRIHARLKEVRLDPAEVVHELALMKYTVNVYRARYPEVKAMWKAQEKAAIAAVRAWGANNPDPIKEGKVSWYVREIAGLPFLCCVLPSGRELRYCNPQVKMHKNRWGSEQPHLSYFGNIKGIWGKIGTYGGKTVENQTQAVARDVQAEALVRLDDTEDLLPVFGVHDEQVAETDLGLVTEDEFNVLMIRKPHWALDCPINAEPKKFHRYRKA